MPTRPPLRIVRPPAIAASDAQALGAKAKELDAHLTEAIDSVDHAAKTGGFDSIDILKAIHSARYAGTCVFDVLGRPVCGEARVANMSASDHLAAAKALADQIQRVAEDRKVEPLITASRAAFERCTHAEMVTAAAVAEFAADADDAAQAGEEAEPAPEADSEDHADDGDGELEAEAMAAASEPCVVEITETRGVAVVTQYGQVVRTAPSVAAAIAFGRGLIMNGEEPSIVLVGDSGDRWLVTKVEAPAQEAAEDETDLEGDDDAENGDDAEEFGDGEQDDSNEFD